ncbi:hypothetical protein D3C87_2134790 [compost metagenome]
MKGYNNAEALQKIELEMPPSNERDEIINFIRNSERGIMKSPFQTTGTSETEAQS